MNKPWFSLVSSFVWILLALLTLCNAFLLWQNHNLKNEIARLTEDSKVQIGEDFKNFSAVDIDSNPTSWNVAQKPKKIVLFFSTTCPYCKKQNSYWTDLIKSVDNSKYEVFAVFNRREEIEAAKEYLESFGYHDLVLSVKVVFSEGENLEKYKLKSTPTTLVLDENDRVEKAWIGLWSPNILAEANSFFNTSIPKKDFN